MKIGRVEAELLHADRQPDERADMTKIAVAFRSFCERVRKLSVFATGCIFVLVRAVRQTYRRGSGFGTHPVSFLMDTGYFLMDTGYFFLAVNE
jgi:hypothetical protein